MSRRNSIRAGSASDRFKRRRIVLAWAVFLLPTAFVYTDAASGSTQSLPTDIHREFQLALGDFDLGQQLLSSQPDRARQLFRSAAERFTRIVRSGITSGPLEFNLGNAFVQAGQIGHAILHYRRAERLIPRDELLADNLSVARKRCLTTITPRRASVLVRSVFFWHYRTSIRERLCAAIASYIGFWALLTLRSIVPRRSATVTAIVAGALSLIAASSVGVDRWSDRTAPAGVILAMDVTVNKGPGTGYQRQFEQPLQSGVEFVRRESRAGWWRIELPDGQSGWIDEAAAELVPSG